MSDIVLVLPFFAFLFGAALYFTKRLDKRDARRLERREWEDRP